MSIWKPDWAPTEGLAVGKGATLQEFIATVGITSLKSMWPPGARAI
jgi:hypothetical protein